MGCNRCRRCCYCNGNSSNQDDNTNAVYSRSCNSTNGYTDFVNSFRGNVNSFNNDEASNASFTNNGFNNNGFNNGVNNANFVNQSPNQGIRVVGSIQPSDIPAPNLDNMSVTSQDRVLYNNPTAVANEAEMVENHYYHRNHIHRYNDYYEVDVDHYEDYYYDHNRYHRGCRAVYEGSNYMGTFDETVDDANNGTGRSGNNGTGRGSRRSGCRC